jgi:hypothetical protein
MIILNILNFEKIIFLNKNIQNYFRINHEKYYNEWQGLIYTNNKSEKFRFYIKMLNAMNSKQLLCDIEKILMDQIVVENFDVGLVKHYDINLEELEKFEFSKYNDFKSFSICRNEKNINITFWR